MKIAVIQMNSQSDKEKNLEQATFLLEKAAKEAKPDLAVLPETFSFIGGSLKERMANAETFPEGKTYQTMSKLAKKLRLNLHAGSWAEKAEKNKVYNTSIAFNREGEPLARYRKIHLFDVKVPGDQSYLESETVKPGTEVVVYELEGVKIGCAICYDLRFPEFFYQLSKLGAQLFVLPAAFTQKTGEHHWEPLLKARAIENQCYMAASAQVFSHNNGKRECFGHSMVIDPWGRKMASCQKDIGYITAEIDVNYVKEVRKLMPVREHHRLV